VLVLVYACGVAQLALVTGLAPAAAVGAGLLPFVVPDALKTVAAVLLAGAVRVARSRY
jgi:biotin transport system substrate-specific component